MSKGLHKGLQGFTKSTVKVELYQNFTFSLPIFAVTLLTARVSNIITKHHQTSLKIKLSEENRSKIGMKSDQNRYGQ